MNTFTNFLTRQLLVVALLALAFAAQGQNGNKNTATNPQLEQRLTERLEWIKTHYPERYAKMDEHELEMFREHEMQMMQLEDPDFFNHEPGAPASPNTPDLKPGTPNNEPQTTNNEHGTLALSAIEVANNKQKYSDNSRLSANDSLALVALYNATGGPNWYTKANWLTGPVSAWSGITVTEGFVTQIDLSYNNLIGNIPSEIGSLTHLQSLYLYNNQLTGNIPSEIGNLSQLLFLFLSFNGLTGSIPQEIGNIVSLQSLFLCYNELSGIIPTSIENLTNLIGMDLSYNQLSGTIPNQIGNLTNLLYLLIHVNQFTGNIPPEIGNLMNLKTFTVSSELLTGSIPKEIGNLINLESLSLDNSNLTGNIPNEIGNLTNLQHLFVVHNQLTGTIPESFSNLSNLKSLSLYYNQITGTLPLSLCNLGNLELLGIGNNQITGNIPYEIGNMANLRIIDFSSNLLTGSIPVEICYLENLSQFLFYDNYFDQGSCPSIFCLTNNGVNMVDGSQLNGYNLLTDCGTQLSVDLCVEEAWKCKDGSGYNFENVTIQGTYNTLQWFTYDGDGFFDNENQINTIYYPGTNDYQQGFVTLCLIVTGDNGFVEDCMTVYFIALPGAYAGSDVTIMEGNTFSISDAWASNYNFLFWTTSGSGEFIDANIQNPVYTPSGNDLLSGSVQLCLNVINDCGNYTDCMNLFIENTVACDQLTLSSGWNLVSLDVIPNPSLPEAVFAPLITASNLELVTGFQNQMKVFFDPFVLPFLNTLTEIKNGFGYWVKVSGEYIGLVY